MRVIAFDAYGTLFDLGGVSSRCEYVWPGRGAALAELWRRKQIEYSWQRSLMDRYVSFAAVTREALEFACEHLTLPLDEQRAKAVANAYSELEPFADARGAIAALRSAGHVLAVLTNGSPDMIEPLVTRSFGDAFYAIVSVHQARVFKPSPRAYNALLERLSVQPVDVTFVTSNAWDAAGAIEFGFRTLWVNRGGASFDRVGCPQPLTVTGLDGVAAIVDSEVRPS